MDLDRIVTELRNERDRIDRAIASLENRSVGRPARTAASAPSSKQKGGITAAGRKRLSEAMKRRWAERRTKSGKAASSASASSKKRGGMTPAARKRLSQMMKKRWAERRKSGLKKLG